MEKLHREVLMSSADDSAPILLLSPRYSSDSRILRQAALQAGWHVERLGDWSVPERLRGRKLIFSGEPSYMKVIAHKLSYALLDAPLDWLTHLPLLYRKRAIQFMTLAEARNLAHPTFIKPAGEKVFAAAVYSSSEPLPPADESISDTTPVLTSEPVSWDIEFRFFVRERQVTTFSSYWRVDHLTRLDDETWEALPTEVADARDFMQALLANPSVPLPPAIAIDIGRIHDRGWAVIESNAAWAAGIYGCEPHQILPVLERACIHRARLSSGDALWECNRNAKRAR
jgi:hypothetical protein